MVHRRIRRGCGGVALVVLVLVAATLAWLVYQGRQTPGGRPDYVALGSSFAAGAGLGKLQPGSPLLCARSLQGYPQQLARMRHLAIVDMSCGGAVTRHVLQGGQYFQGAQIRTITGATRLVTVTVGGNDIGYIGDLSMLAARRSGSAFGMLVRLFWHGPAATRPYTELHANLLATIRAIRTRAPHATIMVATYPTILPPSGTCPRLGLSIAEADAMRQVADRLAAVTRAAAAEGGAVLVDMHRLGARHDACSAEPWTRGWTNGGVAPFHPTAAGAAAISTALDRPI
jgi:lysophospholipase L1-like esterase